jgi:small-conductance mechanosensitive channel
MTTPHSRLSDIDWLQFGMNWGLRLAVALALVLFGLWFARVLSRIIARALERGGADAILRDFLRNLSYAIVLVVVLIMALGTAGVQTTSLLAVLGAAGLAIGLALKDSLANIASGVLLIVLRPFHGGDSVKVGGIEGVVEQVRIFHTVLRTAQNHAVILPNSQITNEAIVNFTAKGMRRIDLPVGISYDASVPSARDALLAVAAANDKVLSAPAAEVAAIGFGEGGINLVLRAWVKAIDHGAAASELVEAAHQEFKRVGLHPSDPSRYPNRPSSGLATT